MSENGYRVKFKTCEHDWELHVDVEHCGGPAAGNGIFMCNKCKTFLTMLEKTALDTIKTQEESLKTQEKMTKISMKANIIAAGVLVIAFLSLALEWFFDWF